MEEEKGPWGYHLRINAGGLNPETIRDAERLRSYLIEICDLIKMTRYGDPIVVRFGKDPLVSGYTIYQMIEESNIGAHLVESSNTGYFDIFSCMPFDIQTAIDFTLKFFEAKRHNADYAVRDVK